MKKIKCKNLAVFYSPNNIMVAYADRRKNIFSNATFEHNNIHSVTAHENLSFNAKCHLVLDSSLYYAELVNAPIEKSDRKLYKKMKWKSKQLSPWGKDDIIHDYQNIKKNNDGTTSLILSIAKREQLSRIRNYFLSAGIVLSTITTIENAILKLIEKRKNNGLTVFYYLASDSIRLLVFNDNMFVDFIILPLPDGFSTLKHLVSDSVRANAIAASWSGYLAGYKGRYGEISAVLFCSPDNDIVDFFTSNDLADSVEFEINETSDASSQFEYLCLKEVCC